MTKSDIVERLREQIDYARRRGARSKSMDLGELQEAADEIEATRKEVLDWCNRANGQATAVADVEKPSVAEFIRDHNYIVAATIERCAQVAERQQGLVAKDIAADIRRISHD